MAESSVAPYGSWKSPISSELIVAGTIGLGQIAVDGEDIYWLEMRPTEGGRNVLVRCAPDGQISDVTPSPFNVRSRVHEYGGGAFTVADGVVYFVNFADQRLYRQLPDAAPEPITPEENWRYADGRVDPRRERFICVREDHTPTDREAVNEIVSVSLNSNQTVQVLASGNDFYASPRLNPDGTRLAWLTWNHPNMPWDGTELWVAAVNADGSVGEAEQVAGGVNESIFQPEWSPDGTLYFISDRSGWWNLYRWRDRRVEPLCPMESEFGTPQWVFGLSTYGFAGSDRLICTYGERGVDRLASLNTQTLQLEPIELPYPRIGSIQVTTNQVVFTAGSPTEPTCLTRLNLSTQQVDVLRRSSTIEIDSGYLSMPQVLEFPTTDGMKSYGFFYPPANKDYTAPTGEKPPLLVKSHGGPTAATAATFNLGIQFWTSRGIAVLDVNYRGSSGYGRAYRQQLQGQWGIADVDDCVNGARYLAEQGLADGDRLMIDGGSAGGYTTLCALIFRDVFKAGASYYGVSDLEALATETHKFESRYLDGLIGPYPECRDVYLARSPIHFCDRLSCPVIFFQGLEDKIVPPNQAETMVNVLREKKLPVAYVAFAGEQHGFRQAANIKRTLDGELYFYSKVFGFELADEIEPIVIDNL